MGDQVVAEADMEDCGDEVAETATKETSLHYD